MAGFTAYSMNGVDWVPLPRGPRFAGTFGEREQIDLELVTGRGVRWIYRLFDRDNADLTFRFPSDEKADFRMMHDLADGKAIPFYFTLDYTASPLVAIYARKEAGFKPVILSQASDPVIYEYNLKLTGEISPDSVEE